MYMYIVDVSVYGEKNCQKFVHNLVALNFQQFCIALNC